MPVGSWDFDGWLGGDRITGTISNGAGGCLDGCLSSAFVLAIGILVTLPALAGIGHWLRGASLVARYEPSEADTLWDSYSTGFMAYAYDGLLFLLGIAFGLTALAVIFRGLSQEQIPPKGLLVVGGAAALVLAAGLVFHTRVESQMMHWFGGISPNQPTAG